MFRKWAFLITSLISFEPTFALAQDLCSTNYQALCDISPPNSPSEREIVEAAVGPTKLPQILADAQRAQSAKDSTTRSAAWRQVADINVRIYNEIIRRLEAKGIHEADLHTLFENLKGDIISRISGEKIFRETSHFDQMVARLRGVKMFTARDLTSGRTDEIKDFVDLCRSDGLIVNAEYSAEDNVVTVCPGVLLSVLQTDDLLAVSFTLGHEIGHSIDPSGTFKGSPATSPFLVAYQGYLACMEERPKDTFRAPFDVGSDSSFPEQIRLEKACLQRLEAERTPPIYDITWLQRTLAHQFRKGETVADELRALKSRLSAGFDAVTAHSPELIADRLGTVSAIDEIIKAPKVDVAKVVFDGLTSDCLPETATDPDVEKECGLTENYRKQAVEDDRLHPRPLFRLQEALANPELRHLLGCIDPVPGPYCALGDGGRL